jgi:hypothetical protein
MADDRGRWMAAWLALLRTHARLWDQLEASLRRDHGLSIARYDVLTHVEMAGGALRLSELASSIVLSPSGLSKLVDRMEASALIQRDPDPLQQTFGDALDDRDLADLVRIMGRIGASIPDH